MRGLWTEENKKLAIEVAEGNPGALRVIDELLWFSDWHKMMVWCRDNGLKGPALWEKYKDVFKQDFNALGGWIKDQMFKAESIHPIKLSKLPREGFKY